MKNTTGKGILLTKITAVISFLLGCLLFITITEHLERGEVNLFLVFLTAINGVCGILGGIFLFFLKEQGRILIKYQFITGLFFIIFYSAINDEWISPMIFLLSLFLITFILSRLKIVKGSIRNIDLLDTKKGNILFNSSVKIFFSVLILLLVFTWVFKWEEYLNIFHSPNGEGLTFYHQIEGAPKFQVSVEGGYVYDVFPTQIFISQNKPSTRITIDSYDTGNLRVNILNSSDNVDIYLNKEEIAVERGDNNSIWELSDRDLISYVQNHSYSSKDYGFWFDLELESGGQYFIETVERSVSEQLKSSEIRFFVMSDLHSGYLTYIPELKKIQEERPDFLIINGDIVNWGFPTEYMITSLLTRTFSTPVYTTVGNHDIWNNGKELYNRYFGPDYYSFEYKNSYFIFLDTSRGIIGNTQLQWLEKELETNMGKNVLVFSHMSPIDTVLGSYDGTKLIDEELSSTMFSRAESEYILKLMTQYDVKAFVSGHSHVMGRTLIGETLYISTGALGGSVQSGHTVGYIDCEINNLDIEFSDIIIEDVVSENIVRDSLNTVRVFGIPFLINKSFRIAVTLILLILSELIWFMIIKRKVVYNEKR